MQDALGSDLGWATDYPGWSFLWCLSWDKCQDHLFIVRDHPTSWCYMTFAIEVPLLNFISLKYKCNRMLRYYNTIVKITYFVNVCPSWTLTTLRYSGWFSCSYLHRSFSAWRPVTLIEIFYVAFSVAPSKCYHKRPWLFPSTSFPFPNAP
jgi:hypothetical protein